MIQKSGDYYIYQDPSPSQKINAEYQKAQLSSVTLQATGNIKQKIYAIRERFNQIEKDQVELQQKNQSQSQSSIFQKITSTPQENLPSIDIEIYIPQQILKLDQKLSRIEEKLKPNQILRQKIQTKGTLIQRIKLLQQKLKSILEKSSEIIVTNIQNYCSALDDKDDYLKIMFLREAHFKMKGMKEEINVLESYLKSLNSVQTKIKAIEPIEKSIKTHSQLVKLRSTLSNKISQLFNHMKTTYVKILQQIDSVHV